LALLIKSVPSIKKHAGQPMLPGVSLLLAPLLCYTVSGSRKMGIGRYTIDNKGIRCADKFKIIARGAVL